MTHATITAHFTEPNEYLAELERDRRQVERGIVRVTKIARPDSTGAMVPCIGYRREADRPVTVYEASGATSPPRKATSSPGPKATRASTPCTA